LTQNTRTPIQWIIVILIPFFLAFVTITALVSPFYPRFEYAKASFPPDLEGLSLEWQARLAERYQVPLEAVAWTQLQRRDLALVAVDYLMRWDSAENTIFLLEDQRIPGSESALYNQDEIDHMIDVKRLTDAIRIGAIVLGVVIAAGAVVIGRSGGRAALAQTVWRGGLSTGIILAVVALFVLLAWETFFVQFHELLFPPGSWTFLYTDSLIRLFPEKFWFDFGVLVTVGTLVEGLLLAVIGRILLRRTA
jgi:integral membrane protein (TIGR01906 family)